MLENPWLFLRLNTINQIILLYKVVKKAAAISKNYFSENT